MSETVFLTQKGLEEKQKEYDELVGVRRKEVADRIKAGLQPLIAFVQPDVVAIGGSIGPFVPYFLHTLSGLLAESLPAAISVPKIISAPNPEEIVLYGCYDNATSQHSQN